MPPYRYWDGGQWTNEWIDGTPKPQFQVAQPQPPAPPLTMVASPPNHALHAIITICTCGLWLPVWIIITIAGGKVKVTR